MQRHHEGSAALCAYVREQSGPTALLSFSAGKDAVAAWIQMRRYFDRIVPFYLYLVPDLEFVEQGLRYYEDAMQTEIIRLPHPSLFRWLRNLVFQPPERCQAIEDARLPRWDYKDLEEHIRDRLGLDSAFIGIGTRTADSPIRLANIRRYGSLTPNRRSFCPVYDWRLDDVVREIRASGLKLTVDYQLFGRSFDGIDARFLRPIRDNFPRDYERILNWFPLADLEIMREELSR